MTAFVLSPTGTSGAPAIVGSGSITEWRSGAHCTFAATKVHVTSGRRHGGSLSMGLSGGPRRALLAMLPASLANMQLAKRATFHLGEFLARSTAHKLLVLLALSLFFVLIGGFAFIAADRDRKEADDPFWSAVRGVINPFEDDWHSTPLRAVSLCVASLGVVFFGILINILTESVESSIAKLASGYTPVLASGHVLHVGRANARSAALLAAALRRSSHHNTGTTTSHLARNTTHVLMVPDDRAYTEAVQQVEDVATAISGNRVECRVGSVFSKDDLDRVGVERAAAVVFSAPDGVPHLEADRAIIGQLVAFRQAAPNFKGRVVAQLATVSTSSPSSASSTKSLHFRKSAASKSAASKSAMGTSADISSEAVARGVFRHSSGKVSLESVRSEELLGRFLVQALQQPGLNAVVSSMMDGNATHAFSIRTVGELLKSSSHSGDALLGKTLKQTVLDVGLCSGGAMGDESAVQSSGFVGSGAMLCGFVDPVSNRVVLEVLSDELVLREDSELLLFGELNSETSENDRSISHRSQPLRLVQPRKLMLERKKAGARRRVLICGWRQGMADMLQELDATLPRGSSVLILADESTGCPPDEMRSVLSGVRAKNAKIHGVYGKPDRYEALEQVFKKGSGGKHGNGAFDHVVTLAMRDSARGESAIVADGRALSTLAYLQALVVDAGKTTVTVQFSNEQFEQLAWETTDEVDNVLLPNAIAARIASETLADPRLNAMWTELLSQFGREVYLKPAREHVNVNVNVNVTISERVPFTEVAQRALKKSGAIAIGYATDELGAVLCPTGDAANAPREWREEDVLIVLEH